MSKRVVENTGKGMYRIKYDGGGKVPNSLLGLFTSVGYAETAIAIYNKGIANKIPNVKPRKQRVPAAKEEPEASPVAA